MILLGSASRVQRLGLVSSFPVSLVLGLLIRHPARMDVPGAVFVVLTGPGERQAEALEAVQVAGIYAERSLRDEGRAVEAFFYDGSGRASSAFLEACAERARVACEGTGYGVEVTGVLAGGGVATRKHVYVRGREGVVGFAYDDYPLPLAFQQLQYAEQFGVPMGDVEFRDPPEMQVPDGPVG